ncbi:MAG: sugar transferase [Candidatus Komeilibacteria bacterium]|nr:sugar transferase [Candidatus Komeilibacteria bacterium]
MNHFGLKISKISALFGDIILLYLSLLITLVLRYRGHFDQTIWQSHWPIFSGLFCVWLLIFYSFNLYDPDKNKNFLNLFNNFLPAAIVNLSLGIIYFYILAPKTNITPKTVLVILLAVFTLFFFFSRKLLNKIHNSDKLYQNLLFIGYQPLISQLLPESGNKRFGFVFKGIVTEQPLTPTYFPLPCYPLERMEEILKQEKINLVVINETDNQNITNILFKALPLRINFISLTAFYEQVNQRVPLEIISRGWFLDNFSEGSKNFYEPSKKLLDLALCLITGIVSLILIPFIALAIKLSSNGPILFKQIRVGKDGQTFLALKFRTMYENAEKSGPMWARENDPRITKVGRFLRKVRLDEIPQLINILKGDMSFVGPRPERPEFINELELKIPFYKERLLVKPGLTGWAQINFPYADSAESSLKKLQYDLYYIKHRSFFLDLSVVLKTISIVFKQSGR